MNTLTVKSPYSYFGGKSRVAKIIWTGLGDINNYVEPFAGSLAVLLANSKIPKLETVNDIDCFICNFWRAVSNDPEGVAKFADYPVIEADLHARQRWLLNKVDSEFKKKIDLDADYYDLQVAGYWIWGIGASIGNNWLNTKGLNSAPLLSFSGGGIHGLSNNILDWFKKLQQRTRKTRVCCGDWKRIVTPSVTYQNKSLSATDMTGVFLDPPYPTKGRDKVYNEDGNIFGEVCKWAIENGDNPKLRIVLCGYDGDHHIPDTWKIYSWQANGGFANLGDDRGRINKKSEKIWFSPHCLDIK